jgi:hypothetical protein
VNETAKSEKYGKEDVMKKLMMILILVLLFSLFLGADVYMKTVETVKPFEMMGKKMPEQTEIRERWMGVDKFALHMKEYSIVIDEGKGKLFLIIHQPKIYVELPTNITKEKILGLLVGLSPKAAEVIGSMTITDVNYSTGLETKKIANWNCSSSEFEMVIMIPALNMMPKFKIKMWTTKDLPAEYRKYTKVAEEFFVKYILGMIKVDENSKKAMEKMSQSEGFEVATEITVNIFGSEIKMESQCLEVMEKPAPPGTYSVPSGYTKKPIPLS